MDWTAREKSLGMTRTEIAGEMAAALGRIGRRLDAVIHSLTALREEIGMADKNEKQRLLPEYDILHKEASLYYWYLIVQRESIGLRDHQVLADVYRIPPKNCFSSQPRTEGD